MFSENFKSASAYVLICLLWGSTWMFIRMGLDSLTPLFSAGLRFLFASVFIYAMMKFKNLKLQTDSLSIKLYIAMGLFSFVIPFGLVYWAEQFIPSGLASVLFAVFPFFVIIWSRIAMPGNKIGPYQLIGVVLGFLGIFAIFSENLSVDITSDFWGMLAVFSSAMMQGGITVAIKKYGGYLHPLSMNFIPVLMGGVLLVILGFSFEDYSTWKFDVNAFTAVIYLGFFGTLLTFTTYYWLMKRISVVIISLSTFLTPIVAVFLGWFFLDELLSIRDFIGSSLVLIGILFANLKGLRNYYRLNFDRTLRQTGK